MMKSKDDLLKQATEAIKNCYWRKDLGGISICSFACLPCERTIDNGKCEVLIKMFKGNQKDGYSKNELIAKWNRRADNEKEDI